MKTSLIKQTLTSLLLKSNEVLNLIGFNTSLDSYALCAYNGIMDFQWDANKAKANFKKHGVRFADAIGVFDDPFAMNMEDIATGDEQRFIAIGLDLTGSLVVVVYTYRGDRVRLISVRKATPREAKEYERRIRF